MLGTWGAAPLFAQFLNGSNAFGEGRAIWRRLAEAKTPEASDEHNFKEGCPDNYSLGGAKIT